MSSIESGKEALLNSVKKIAEQYGVTLEVAFNRWACENILNITEDSKIDEILSISGSNDYGVDFFYHDDVGDADKNIICWGQVKFSEKLNHLVTIEEITKFGDTLRHLTENPDEGNPVFKTKSDLFNSLGGKDADINKKMLFIVTGDLNDQAKKEYDTRPWKQKIENFKGPKIDCEIVNLQEILKTINTPSTENLKISFDGKDVLERVDSITKKNTVVGYVKAKELVNVIEEHNGNMFNENPRESLSSQTPTNKAITETLQDDTLKHQFWKLNNGITAVCESFDDHQTRNPRVYSIKNLKIVNGRQTTASLIKNKKLLDDLVTVELTIHETVDPEERNRISEATNTQNPVKPVDLITNLDEMTALSTQCGDKFPNFWFERQTKGYAAAIKSKPNLKKTITKRRVLEKNLTARSYLAYSITPMTAMKSDSEIFSTVNRQYIDMIFKDRDIDDLIIPHIFRNMIEGLLLKWTREIKAEDYAHLRDKEIINKKIVQYFILRLIGDGIERLSVEQQTSLKRKMLESFGSLEVTDDLPESFNKLAETSFTKFMWLFNLDSNSTWPDLLLEKMNAPGYIESELDIPTPYEIMYKLKLKGTLILKKMRQNTGALIADGNIDSIKEQLLKI